MTILQQRTRKEPLTLSLAEHNSFYAPVDQRKIIEAIHNSLGFDLALISIFDNNFDSLPACTLPYFSRKMQAVVTL
jgi:sensor histidine kinase YesM